MGFLSMLLGTLGAPLVENLLTGKGLYRTGYGNNQEIKKKKGSNGTTFLNFILIVLVLNTFQKKLKKLLNTKASNKHI